MPGFEARTLAKLASKITSGGTPTSGDPRYYAPTGVPFVKIDDMTRTTGRSVVSVELYITDAAVRESAAKVFPPGSILISMYGTIGLTKTLVSPMATNQAIAALLPPFSCDPSLLMHVLERARPRLERAASQTTQANISATVLNSFVLSLPTSLTEQRGIAAILDTVDEAIRCTEQLIAKLQHMKQGLVHDLLTCGIDDNGEIRNPEKHPEQFKESTFGRIPKVWYTAAIGSLAVHVGSGLTPRGGRDVYRETGVLFIRSQNVHFDGLRLDDAVFIDGAMHHVMARSEVYANDVLMNITGASIGRCCAVPSGIGPANVNQHVCAVRLAGANGSDAVFLAAFLASPFGQQQVIVLNAGSNRQGLNYEQLRSFEVVWPGAPERAAIAEVLEDVDGRREAEKRALDKLRLLKAGLVEDLLTGRVRVTKLLEGSVA